MKIFAFLKDLNINKIIYLCFYHFKMEQIEVEVYNHQIKKQNSKIQNITLQINSDSIKKMSSTKPIFKIFN